GSTINPVDRDRDAACLMGSGNVSPFAASFAGMRLLSEICQKKSTPCGTQKIGVRYKSFDVLWSQWSGLNRRPTVYETVALPLSYIGAQSRNQGKHRTFRLFHNSPQIITSDGRSKKMPPVGSAGPFPAFAPVQNRCFVLCSLWLKFPPPNRGKELSAVSFGVVVRLR